MALFIHKSLIHCTLYKFGMSGVEEFNYSLVIPIKVHAIMFEFSLHNERVLFPKNPLKYAI